MSELVALSFDSDASPSMRFGAPGALPNERAAAPIYGWGVGWYPSSERGASVIKDPTSSGESTVNDVLGDWNRFRSTLFVCHLRGHNRARSQEDAQPFVRSYGGRQWIFAHDGDLSEDYAERLPLNDDPSFEPLGRTDSEHAFCWLLSRLRSRNVRSLQDVDANELREWLLEIDRAGRANILLTDGELLAAYCDAGQEGTLHWTRRIPPHPTTHLGSDALRIDLESPEDPNRTALVFSSLPLSADVWLPLAPSALVLSQRGSVVWESQPLETRFASSSAAPVAGGVRSQAGHQRAAAQPLPQSSQQHRPFLRQLSIEHETRYQYESEVERSSHRFLLRPVDDRYQRLEEFAVELVPGGHSSVEFEDVFGNDALALEIDRPFRELRIASRARVRVEAVPPLEHRSANRRSSIPLVWMPWQRQMLAAYLLPPELPETELQELSDFAMSFVERNGADLVGTLLDLNDTLYRDFEYVSGSTTIETTAYQVFESRRGVCQDFANLMICLARLLNVPARYRMGYIFTGADYENKIQSDASHAWVELYVPRVGWHGFDPTNGRQAGSEHVRVACGRHYRDATPTAGTIYRGGGMETLTISVRVEETDQAGPSV